MIDRIHIEQLEVRGRVGVLDSERAEPQRLSLNVTLWPKIAELHDNIANTVNYSALAECAKEFVNQHDYKLIETLAEETAAHLLAQFDLRKVELEVRKFVLPDANYVSVTADSRRGSEVIMREGRFSSPASEIAQRYSESVSFDRRLYRHDIAGSIAHAAALASAGILAADEFEMITRGLREIENEIAAGTFVWDTSLEDVHMNIEAALTKRIGPAGAKLHTGRSRNDQIALDLRLYVREEIDEIVIRLRALQNALLLLAQKNSDVLMPGYTHLQRAQPIYFAHYLLAQLEAFERDHERLRDTRRRADVMPLGSGALAGSTIALDREAIAKALGFQRVTQNSVDAVSDRDFAADFLYSLAMIGIHLSLSAKI